MSDHRILTPDGPLPFTCENEGYKTNVEKGEHHGQSCYPRGSVFLTPLINYNGYTLWLEHVIEKATQYHAYWLMWYKPDGVPSIPASSIFGKDELRQMISRLADSGIPGRDSGDSGDTNQLCEIE